MDTSFKRTHTAASAVKLIVLLLLLIYCTSSAFEASGTAADAVTLTWTAPGDDGASGTAAAYDIRYATSAITSSNWSSAVPIANIPTPQPAGTRQSVDVNGLDYQTIYYFAIKAVDESGNWSGLSNVTSIATGAEPFPPATVADLRVIDSTASSLVIQWTAPGDDNTSGTASQYDIRYASDSLVVAGWLNATRAAGEPAPAPAGSIETFEITGLSPDSTYYVGIRTADEVPNWSGLSNIPHGNLTTNFQTAVADFIVDTMSGCAPLEVQFTDISSGGPVSWTWDLGDGTISLNQNPTHVYSRAGIYTVSLVVSNGFDTDTVTKPSLIQVNSDCSSRIYATSDTTVNGSVTGTFLQTQRSDGNFEILGETESGGKPELRHSLLEHLWTFTLPEAGTNVFTVEAYRPDNPDNDNFRFEFSLDGFLYTPLCVVTTATVRTYSAALPSGVSGPIIVRVVDTDHSPGRSSLDNIFIDEMYVESGGEAPPRDTMFVQTVLTDRVGANGKRFMGRARVQVVDLYGQLVRGAQVRGTFTGATSGTAYGVTGDEGWTEITSSPTNVKSYETWCFDVVDIKMAGADYVSSMNLASSACENDGSIAKTSDSPIEVAQNYPNPFNPTTEISFYLYESGHARLDIYNIAGQRVRTLVDEDLPSGRHVYEWDSHNDKGQRVASGIYLYRVISGGFVKTKKMVLLK